MSVHRISDLRLRSSTMGLLLIACAGLAGCRTPEEGLPAYSPDPAVPMIVLPTEFTSHRVNSNRRIPATGMAELAVLDGPGAVRHVWLLPGEDVRLVIHVDGAPEPQVDMPLKPFFGVMNGRDPYPIDNAAYTVFPNPAPTVPGTPGYNLFLPIPFSESCRISLHGPEGERAVAMVDWHRYDPSVTLTPYRLGATHHHVTPGPPRGEAVAFANLDGTGFIAGIAAGYTQRDHSDMVFHTGGMTILLDGETDPHVIRGHNVEDDFGFTWGFNAIQTRWMGSPWHENRGRLDQDGVFYRFFGPDPIAFQSSALLRTGSRGDEMETVVYAYRIPETKSPAILSPMDWQAVGLFPGGSDGFERSEFVEDLEPGSWPEQLQDGIRQRSVRTVHSTRGWIDLQSVFFERHHTATPLTVVDSAAYLRATIPSETDRRATLRLAFDDRLILWLNGKEIGRLHHNRSLQSARFPVRLMQGPNELLIKNDNSGLTPNNRQWVLHVAVEE